jgi:hypothetical protein
MRLYIDADANTPERGLSIEYQPDVRLPLVRRMLDSTIDSLLVSYLDSRTGRWFGSTEAATIAPIAIRLSLHSSDSTASPLIGLPLVFAIGDPSSPTFRRPGR